MHLFSLIICPTYLPMLYMRYDHIGFTDESNSAMAKFGESNALSVLSKSWLYQMMEF